MVAFAFSISDFTNSIMEEIIENSCIGESPGAKHFLPEGERFHRLLFGKDLDGESCMHQHVISNLDLDQCDVGRIGHGLTVLNFGFIAVYLDYLTGYR